jgi:hypothetical protein
VKALSSFSNSITVNFKLSLVMGGGSSSSSTSSSNSSTYM